MPILKGFEPEVGGPHILQGRDGFPAVSQLFFGIVLGSAHGVQSERSDEQKE